MKLAISVGKSRHYRFDTIHARHFIQTGGDAGLPKALVLSAPEEVAAGAGNALACMQTSLPAGFSDVIHTSVSAVVQTRLRSLTSPEGA